MAITECRSRAIPPSDDDLASAIASILRFCRAFGIAVDAEAVTPIYRATLSKLTRAGLIATVLRLANEWRWQSAPKPADLLALGGETVATWLWRAQVADTEMRRLTEPPLPKSERVSPAQVAEIMARVRGNLDAGR